LINTPGVPSNGLSHYVEPYDLTRFIPEVQKSLQKLQLLRDSISIDPIIKKIADWESPLEQVFYVTSLYLKISKRIDPKIRIEEQFRVASSGKGLHIDFRLSLADEVHPDLPPLVAFVECDSRAFHDRTPEELTKDRQRWRELQRRDAKVYPFSGKEILKNPAECVIECVKDLQRDLLTRRDMLMQAFL
jgi:hypothetical protein